MITYILEVSIVLWKFDGIDYFFQYLNTSIYILREKYFLVFGILKKFFKKCCDIRYLNVCARILHEMIKVHYII